MESDKILKLVHLLSERCLYDQAVQQDGLEKMKDIMVRLGEIEESFLKVEEWLNVTQSGLSEPFESPSESSHWLIFEMCGKKFEDLIGLSVIASMVLAVMILGWLVVWVGRSRQRREMRNLAQVTFFFFKKNLNKRNEVTRKTIVTI